MPIPVIRYRCQFGCGKRTSTKQVIEKHESECSKNPVLQACPSCEHQRVHSEYDEVTGQSWLVRKCEVNSSCFHSTGHFKMDCYNDPTEEAMNIMPGDVPGGADNSHWHKLTELNKANPAAITYNCSDWEIKE